MLNRRVEERRHGSSGGRGGTSAECFEVYLWQRGQRTLRKLCAILRLFGSRDNLRINGVELGFSGVGSPIKNLQNSKLESGKFTGAGLSSEPLSDESGMDIIIFPHPLCDKNTVDEYNSPRTIQQQVSCFREVNKSVDETGPCQAALTRESQDELRGLWIIRNVISNVCGVSSNENRVFIDRFIKNRPIDDYTLHHFDFN